MTDSSYMLALLDIGRASRGLSAWKGPDPVDPNAAIALGENQRKRCLSELPLTLLDDLAWMNAVPEYPERWEEVRRITTLIDESRVAIHSCWGVWLQFNSSYRLVIPVEMRSRYILAAIVFDVQNDVMKLATQDHPHDAVLKLLRLIQPIYAFVCSEYSDPGEDLNQLKDALRFPYDTTFLGPELTRRIPPHLIDPANGFSHIERVGEGVWITFEGVGFRGTETDEQWLIFERHRAARQNITDFLKTLPAEVLGPLA